MKSWLQKVVDRITGRLVEEEKQKTTHVITEAQCTVRDSRAMLNGEEMWLIPNKKRNLCDGP